LLHQFPFEANVAARFTVLEERAEAELIDRLRLAVLLEAAAAPDRPLGRALAAAIVAAADQTFADVVRDAMPARAAATAWLAHAGGVEAAVAELSEALGIAAGEGRAHLDAEIVEGPNLPSATWRAVAATLAAGSPADRNQAACLLR